MRMVDEAAAIVAAKPCPATREASAMVQGAWDVIPVHLQAQR